MPCHQAGDGAGGIVPGNRATLMTRERRSMAISGARCQVSRRSAQGRVRRR